MTIFTILFWLIAAACSALFVHIFVWPLLQDAIAQIREPHAAELAQAKADLLLSREQTRAAEEARERSQASRQDLLCELGKAKAEVGKGLRAYDRELEGRLAAENALEQAQASGRELLASIASESTELTELKQAFATLDGQLRECESQRDGAVRAHQRTIQRFDVVQAEFDALKASQTKLAAKPKAKAKPKPKKRGAA